MGFGKNNTGVIIRSTETVALSTLSNVTALKLGSGVSITEDFRMLKEEIFAVVTGLTAGEGAGLCLGIANGELSVSEIQECLVADGPVDRNDRVPQERAERFVKLFAAAAAGGEADTTRIIVNENGGTKIVVKPQWSFSNPEGWDHFVWNLGPTLTTGATIFLTVVTYGVWLT